MTSSPVARLPWLDHLRTLVIILVVNLHACVTYSHVGDWYFKSAQEPTLLEKVPFIVWEAHLQAFFMGLLFFVSGYLAHGSLARKGPAQFVRERLIRLGLPALAYMLLIHPFILLVLNPWNHDFGPPGVFYTEYLVTGRFLRSSGPLWFAVALLFFSTLLAVFRSVGHHSPVKVSAPNHDASRPIGANPPPSATLWIFACALGAGTFAVRLAQPIGTNVLNMQLGYFVQYVTYFAAGVHAARHGWLLPLVASPRARMAGWVTLGAGPVALLALMFGGMTAGKVEYFFGGWHWQAFGFALWEQLAGVGLSLGALAFASRKLNLENARLRWLDDRSFAVYVLHAPVLVGLAMLFRSLPPNLYALVALLTLTGLLVSFIAADLTRRVASVCRARMATSDSLKTH